VELILNNLAIVEGQTHNQGTKEGSYLTRQSLLVQHARQHQDKLKGFNILYATTVWVQLTHRPLKDSTTSAPLFPYLGAISNSKMREQAKNFI
jgi:hypothetical protein